jgi:hypothetical protein
MATAHQQVLLANYGHAGIRLRRERSHEFVLQVAWNVAQVSVGGLMLARTVKDRVFSDEILAACRTALVCVAFLAQPAVDAIAPYSAGSFSTEVSGTHVARAGGG